MENAQLTSYIQAVLAHMPTGWLSITTHRLDIYDEKLAKTQFLDQFEELFRTNNASATALVALPTAYDYIRLGHPLSCVLEWAIAHQLGIKPELVIGFSSKTTPILAILRKNGQLKKQTHIFYTGTLPAAFDPALIRSVYGYAFELTQVEGKADLANVSGSSVFINQDSAIHSFDLTPNTAGISADFYINLDAQLGSVLVINGAENETYVSEIQHVRRRETIAMTPANCLLALQSLIGQKVDSSAPTNITENKAKVLTTIKHITEAHTEALVASSGLSMQYAIMMGLIHDALENHPGKAIRFVVPPNCYGGTNDQARRVAACIPNVEVVDLPVDGGQDMVQSVDVVLAQIAKEDAIPYIIAEIPTNPRVEVPNLQLLEAALSKPRTTATGQQAIDPVFILDQTFCPNVHFLGENEVLASVRTISYASGSKFPSGGECTAGYCVGNKKTSALMEKIALHLNVCDNEATPLQYQILAKQLPSMNQRIQDAYVNTRDFVNFIHEVLPAAKINFVSEELAEQTFTPSVFSLDLPTKGNTDEERENYKRELNLKLIHLMITEIPTESKFCVSYGQLKGCYWTIPATSTQGTTKEGDKDYIVRVALSANMDLAKHKEVFLKFVSEI